MYNVYDEDELEESVDDDELDASDAGFLKGYVGCAGRMPGTKA